MFYSSQKTKRRIAILIIFSIIFSNSIFLGPKNASAVVPVKDVTVDTSIGINTATTGVGNAIQSAFKYLSSQTIEGTSPLLTAAAWAGKKMIRRVLRQMTMSIVAWIDNGFEGSPGFVTDPGKFLQSAADIAIGDMLMASDDLSFLCEPFSLQVKLSLGLQYRPFRDEIKCTLSGVIGDITKFTNGDFIGGGGWDSWLQIATMPQNNQMGAMILAQNELDARIARGQKQSELEASWGGGFLSYKKCTNIQTGEVSRSMNSPVSYNATVNGQTVASNETPLEPVYGPSNTECTIQTPGKEIADQLSWLNSSTLRELELSDDLDAIFNALANMAIKTGAEYFSHAISGNDSKDQGLTNINYLNNLQDQLNNQQGTLPADFYNANGSVNFSKNFTGTTDALRAIEGQLLMELQYDTAQKNIYDLFDTIQASFASSTAPECTLFAKNDVITQITGDFVGTTTPRLVWDKQDIENASSTAYIARNILDNARTLISTGEKTVTEIMPLLQNWTKWHTTIDIKNFTTGGVITSQIKQWINDKIDKYSAPCNVDYYRWNLP